MSDDATVRELIAMMREIMQTVRKLTGLVVDIDKRVQLLEKQSLLKKPRGKR